MIDEKINKALKELEVNLNNLESAKEQVEKTVNSYEELSSITRDYIDKLGIITSKVQELMDDVGKDYEQKVKDFEQDRDIIISTTNAAIDKLANISDDLRKSLSTIDKKINYSLVLNVISLITISVLFYFLLK